MILVLLGTQNNSFHRLLEEIDELIDKGIIKDKVIVQKGYTNYHSDNMEMHDLMSSDELLNYQKKADLIITHGGVGSIVSSLKLNKKVVAVPRLHKYNEHVNDHQKEIIKSFNNKGYIIGIDNVKDLSKAIKSYKSFKPKKFVGNNTKMLNIISNYIDNIN